MVQEFATSKEKLVRLIFGVIIIVLGLMLIFTPALLNAFWLIFIWIPALLMEYNAFKGPRGLFVPGGILITIALALTLGLMFEDFYVGGGWALFVLAPAVGLFQLYLANGFKPKGLLIPVGVLAAIVAVSLVPTGFSKWIVVLVGVVLITLGVVVLLRKK